MHSAPAKYLVLIAAGDGMVAKLFDAQLRHVVDFDASTEEVASMIAGVDPVMEGDTPRWRELLSGHNEAERREARVYSLSV